MFDPFGAGSSAAARTITIKVAWGSGSWPHTLVDKGAHMRGRDFRQNTPASTGQTSGAGDLATRKRLSGPPVITFCVCKSGAPAAFLRPGTLVLSGPLPKTLATAEFAARASETGWAGPCSKPLRVFPRMNLLTSCKQDAPLPAHSRGEAPGWIAGCRDRVTGQKQKADCEARRWASEQFGLERASMRFARSPRGRESDSVDLGFPGRCQAAGGRGPGCFCAFTAGLPSVTLTA